jgi:hypothetical protein
MYSFIRYESQFVIRERGIAIKGWFNPNGKRLQHKQLCPMLHRIAGHRIGPEERRSHPKKEVRVLQLGDKLSQILIR